MKPVMQQHITLYICRTLVHGFTVMHEAEQSVQYEVLGQLHVLNFAIYVCSC